MTKLTNPDQDDSQRKNSKIENDGPEFNESKLMKERDVSTYQFFKWVSMPPYLSEQGAKNLKKYQYAGGDFGLVYIYFYNPVSKWLVEKIPRTIAPNLITLTGFMFTFIPFLTAFTYFGSKFESEEPTVPQLPPMFFYLSAFAYLAYRMLDEMDGKQARRTGNSSPLGLIFDHGCDAFSVGFQCAMMSKSIQCGDNIKTLLFMQGSLLTFHLSTLEEYYAGGLWLQMGNGITDASVAVIAILIIGGVMGHDWWKSIVIEEGQLYAGSPAIQANAFPIAASVLFMPMAIGLNFKSLYTEWKISDKEKYAEGKPYGERLILKPFMIQLITYLYTMIITTSLAYIGSEPIMYRQSTKGELSTFFLLIVLQCFLMQHLTCNMMVCHCTKQIYSPLNNRLNNFVTFWTTNLVILSQAAPQVFDDHVDVQKFIIIMLSITIVCQWYYIINIVKQMAQELNIRVFRVKSQQEQDTTQKLIQNK